jgi:hypothetical protein
MIRMLFTSSITIPPIAIPLINLYSHAALASGLNHNPITNPNTGNAGTNSQRKIISNHSTIVFMTINPNAY